MNKRMQERFEQMAMTQFNSSVENVLYWIRTLKSNGYSRETIESIGNIVIGDDGTITLREKAGKYEDEKTD